MKKIIIMVVCLVLIPSLGFCWWGGDEKKLQRQLQKEAKEINTTLPRMLSNEIQFVETFVRGNSEIVLAMKAVLNNASELNISALKPQTSRSLCSKPDSVELLKKGVTFTYSYNDKNNNYAGEFSITRKDCGI